MERFLTRVISRCERAFASLQKDSGYAKILIRVFNVALMRQHNFDIPSLACTWQNVVPIRRRYLVRPRLLTFPFLFLQRYLKSKRLGRQTRALPSYLAFQPVYAANRTNDFGHAPAASHNETCIDWLLISKMPSRGLWKRNKNRSKRPPSELADIFVRVSLLPTSPGIEYAVEKWLFVCVIFRNETFSVFYTGLLYSK